MSIVVDSLPLLSTSQKLDMLQESEEEVSLISPNLNNHSFFSSDSSAH